MGDRGELQVKALAALHIVVDILVAVVGNISVADLVIRITRTQEDDIRVFSARISP